MIDLVAPSGDFLPTNLSGPNNFEHQEAPNISRLFPNCIIFKDHQFDI